MGSNLSREMADGTLAELGITITLEQALSIHLQGNHYPPVPKSMVAPCIEAINAINGGDDELLITLPSGVSWRNKATAPAWAIAEAHHLDAWLNGDDDE